MLMKWKKQPERHLLSPKLMIKLATSSHAQLHTHSPVRRTILTCSAFTIATRGFKKLLCSARHILPSNIRLAQGCSTARWLPLSTPRGNSRIIFGVPLLCLAPRRKATRPISSCLPAVWSPWRLWYNLTRVRFQSESAEFGIQTNGKSIPGNSCLLNTYPDLFLNQQEKQLSPYNRCRTYFKHKVYLVSQPY